MRVMVSHDDTGEPRFEVLEMSNCGSMLPFIRLLAKLGCWIPPSKRRLLGPSSCAPRMYTGSTVGRFRYHVTISPCHVVRPRKKLLRWGCCTPFASALGV